MARPKGSHDIASKVRGAFLRAMAMAEDDDRPLSVIIYDCLQEKPLDTLNAISKFVPKEMLIEQTLEVTLGEMSDEAIDVEIARLTAETAATSIVERAGTETLN